MIYIHNLAQAENAVFDHSAEMISDATGLAMDETVRHAEYVVATFRECLGRLALLKFQFQAYRDNAYRAARRALEGEMGRVREQAEFERGAAEALDRVIEEGGMKTSRTKPFYF